MLNNHLFRTLTSTQLPTNAGNTLGHIGSRFDCVAETSPASLTAFVPRTASMGSSTKHWSLALFLSKAPCVRRIVAEATRPQVRGPLPIPKRIVAYTKNPPRASPHKNFRSSACTNSCLKASLKSPPNICTSSPCSKRSTRSKISRMRSGSLGRTNLSSTMTLEVTRLLLRSCITQILTLPSFSETKQAIFDRTNSPNWHSSTCLDWFQSRYPASYSDLICPSAASCLSL